MLIRRVLGAVVLGEESFSELFGCRQVGAAKQCSRFNDLDVVLLLSQYVLFGDANLASQNNLYGLINFQVANTWTKITARNAYAM